MNRRAWIATTGIGVPLAAMALITCVGDDAPIGSTDPDGATALPDGATALPDGATALPDGGGSDGAIDSGVDPAACAARTVNEAHAVFVNINGIDSPQCGGASSPRRHLLSTNYRELMILRLTASEHAPEVRS